MPSETYLIGIAGPSGAGKTYLATHLAKELGARVLSLDSYYRDLSHLDFAQRVVANFDAPDALEHELLTRQVSALRRGEPVDLPVYDFATHTRTARIERLHPTEIVIIEGLFTLYWPQLRDLLGTKVFVDTQDTLCLQRRTERDVRERGRTRESVLEQYLATVSPMAHRYVRPTIEHADVVVLGIEPVRNSGKRVIEHYRTKAGEATKRAASRHPR